MMEEELEADDDTGKDTSKYRPSTRPRNTQKDRPGDPFANPPAASGLMQDAPPGSTTKVELDTATGNYVIYEKMGDMDYRPVSTMTFAEYEEYRRKKDIRDAFKAKAAGLDGETPLASKSIVPRIYISPLFDRIFGGNYVDIRPNGSVLLDFGYRHQRVFNPALPIRQQSSGQFLFDQQISLNAQGKIGEKLKVNINQDTKAAFEFDNTIKLDYTGFDHEILQKIEAGNVSLPLSSTLIRGSQNLFGLKTTMQFGKLKVVSVISNQRSTTQSITLKNGAQTKDIAVRVNDYDDNRHYFTGHFFRNRYDQVLRSPPNVTSGTNVNTQNNNLGGTSADFGNQGSQQNAFGGNTSSGSSVNGSASVPASSVNSGITITRVELYVTNRAQNTSTLRNIVALQDLGEYRPLRSRWYRTPGDSALKPLANATNTAYETVRALPNILDVNQASDALINAGLIRSEDFELVRGARKLVEDRDFTVQRQLGYISLNSQLRDDEVLGLAMEYSYQGQVYKVGEMTEDYSTRAEDQVIILKLLRPSQVKLNLPTWNLQMKNIYTLGGGSISKENFQMRIIYRDDSTGVDNPAMPKGKLIKDKPLVQVFNLDRLNPINELQPDGNFDYIEGVTVDSRQGRIIFPVKEPFGSYLRTKFDLNDPADAALANKYCFDELYRGTKSDALQAANKAKFFLIGKGQSVSGSVISTGAFNLDPKAVTVLVGSQTLTLGTDYTVEQSSGMITITNTAVLNSGQDITVRFEKPDLFTFTQKSFFGSRFDYTYSKDLNFGATLLYQNERPIVRRVAVGDEPARNTMIGFDVNYKAESRFLTKMVDALPLIQTKAISTVNIQAEYAHLYPGANTYVDASGKGISFVDDFEAARLPITTFTNSAKMRLASVPVGLEGNRGATDPGAALAYNDRRASISWHVIDPLFYNTSGTLRPTNLSTADLSNNYVRAVPPKEITKNRDLQQVNYNETIFDVAYFPRERGPYNYTLQLDPKGRLAGDARKNWGGLMTDFSTQTDFDMSNVEYIEFWMMDPFMSGPQNVVGGNTDGTKRAGGRMVFDLGQITEDVMRDDRIMFESGLPINNDAGQIDVTPVGHVPRQQVLGKLVFDNDPNNRNKQDLGLDGLSNDEENTFFASNYLSLLQQAGVSDSAIQAIRADPSNDDWSYFLGGGLDAADAKILDRYKRYNLSQGNSPVASGASAAAISAYQTPDAEDINGDNSLNQVDAYYSYKIDFDPNKFKVGQNYIVDQVAGNQDAQWFLFRIPIRDLSHPNALPPTGGISDFKTVKFLRMYMTGFEQPVVARFCSLQVVASQWRKYPKRLSAYGSGTVDEDASNFTVSTVNIEDNGGTSSSGQNKVPYTLPPGAQVRDKDITSGVSRRLNEQSLSLCIENLADGDAKAVFKNVRYDFLNYGRVQAYVHADTRDGSTKNGDMQVFVRLGTDFTDNFYEISVPLNFTAFVTGNNYSIDSIWKRSNFIDCDLKNLYLTKIARNSAGASFNIPFTQEIMQNGYPQNVTVVGNPDLSTVVTLMIGVRNPTNDGFTKSACVWIDEFRMTDYIKNDGWGATGTVNAKLADLATVQASGRYTTPGFGSIEQKISERSRETAYNYNISSTITLDRFIPNNNKKIGLRLPMYVAYQRQNSTPRYDPLNPDVPLEDVPLEGKYANYREMVRDQTTRRSLNFTNVQKVKVDPTSKPHIWDVENLSLTFAYSDMHRTNINIADFTQRQINYGAGYSFSGEPRTFEPFKKVKLFDKPYFKFLKDLNFTPLPSSITIRGDLIRNFTRQQLRSSDIFAKLDPSLLTYEKSLVFNRQYAVRWLPFRSLSIDYSATAQAVIDEPLGDIQGDKAKRDTVLRRVLQLGRLKTYNQTIRVGYKVPFDKLPITDWLQADLSYTAGLNWAAAPLALQDTLGNVLQNSRDRAINGRIDLLKLYNKVKYLQKINTPPPVKPLPPKPPKPTQTPAQKAAAEKAARELKVKNQKERVRLELAIKNAKAKKAPDRAVDSLKTMLKNIDKKQKAADKVKDTTKKAPEFKLLKVALRTLMSLRQVNMQYQFTENTVVSGYKPTPHYAGLSDVDDWQPGVGFVLGSQDPEVRVRLAQAGKLGTSIYQTSPFQQAQTKTFTANATLEPLRDFRLRLDVRQTQTANYNEIYRFDDTTSSFRGFNPTRGGTFSSSFIALGSFRFFQSSGDDDQRRSKEWNEFVQNRFQVRDRLNYLNPRSQINNPSDSLNYDTASQDVLIPAFIAAYTGKKGASVGLSSFPKIPLPNWRIDYSGLSKIPALARIFPTITLSHSYSSTYSIDRYISSLQYGGSTLTLNNSPDQMASRGNNGRFTPVYNVSTVVISEKFAPFLGIDVRTKSKVTIRLSYNRDRAMSLNVSNAQITEVRTQDVTVGLGFAKSGVTLPFIKDKGRPIILKNELTLRADLTVRDNMTIQRRASGPHQYTAGGLDIQFKPTANYVINQRLNIQFYFERTINQPRVSTSYLRKVTAFGFQLRFALQ
ncbi:cell surface protein SprA [Nostoc sp. NIES-2111]